MFKSLKRYVPLAILSWYNYPILLFSISLTSLYNTKSEKQGSKMSYYRFTMLMWHHQLQHFPFTRRYFWDCHWDCQSVNIFWYHSLLDWWMVNLRICSLGIKDCFKMLTKEVNQGWLIFSNGLKWLIVGSIY